jgi:hypothetical protein
MAADPDAAIPGPVLEADLRTLLSKTQANGRQGIVLSLDDGSAVTEDVGFLEDLVRTLDAVGGYGLLVGGFPSAAGYIVEAMSSVCLERFAPVFVSPFRGIQQIHTALTAPMPEATARSWVKAGDVLFLRDVLRLTGGNAHEVMLVGHYLWTACQLGDQDHFSLTPRILDRIIPHLSMLAAGGDALRDGAEAIDRLPDDQVAQALELASMARLTVRQVAIARLLQINSRDSAEVDRALLSADVEAETDRVLEDLDRLQEAGVVQIHPAHEAFSVVGGRPAEVLLKYKARARVGAEASRQPFEFGFLYTVGRALASDAASRTLSAFATGTSTNLGFSTLLSQAGGGRYSPRPAIKNVHARNGIGRLAHAEIALVPLGTDEFELAARLLQQDDATIGLLCTAIAHGRDQLEYTEVWALEAPCESEELSSAWSTTTEETAWSRLVTAADLSWVGSELEVVTGERARQVLIVLLPYAATHAVHQLFRAWRESPDAGTLGRAIRVSDEAIRAMRESGQSDREMDGDLSRMLSRAGFLQSFDDALLPDAQVCLEEAHRVGEADGWVTRWNLANVVARREDIDEAIKHLSDLLDETEAAQTAALIAVYVPGVAPEDSIVDVEPGEAPDLIRLQREIFVVLEGGERDELARLVADYRHSDQAAVVTLAAHTDKWLDWESERHAERAT